jgi:His/Glu/Gln/Arg/opine family amino acid ABC transporter permease subunit
MPTAIKVMVDAAPWLLQGAVMTLETSLLAIALGLPVGIALAVAQRARLRMLRGFVSVYISFARGTPLFIQIMLVFFVLPSLGFDIPRFCAGVIALSLNSGAYIAEMIRGGLTAIPKGQVEAARALSMPRSLMWRHIILPQVLALILPPLTVEFTGLLKGSALLAVIGIVELTRTGQQMVAATFKPLEIWLMVGIFYFVMCYALAALTRYLERTTQVYRAV